MLLLTAFANYRDYLSASAPLVRHKKSTVHLTLSLMYMVLPCPSNKSLTNYAIKISLIHQHVRYRTKADIYKR